MTDDELDPMTKYANRARITVLCGGTREQPHKPLHVACFSRHEDGSWLPVHSGSRDGSSYLAPRTPFRAESGKFDMTCANSQCPYAFRADSVKVSQLLNTLTDRGLTEVSLAFLDAALRHAGRRAP